MKRLWRFSVHGGIFFFVSVGARAHPTTWQRYMHVGARVFRLVL